MKVPLKVGWLSANGLLVKAGAVLGMVVDSSADERGVGILAPTPMRLEWSEDLLFTLDQLETLGFQR